MMSREHSVRELLGADLPAAMALWKTTEGVGLSSDETPEMLARFLARNPGISSAAIAANGELIGAILGGHDVRRGYLYHLAVKSEHRGCGVARALVNRSLNLLESEGLARVTIMVYADNEKGRAFWQRLGWNVRTDLNPMQISLSIPAKK